LLDESVLLLTEAIFVLEVLLWLLGELWTLLLRTSKIWRWLNSQTSWEDILVVLDMLLILVDRLLVVLVQWLNELLVMFLVWSEVWWWSLVWWELWLALELRLVELWRWSVHLEVRWRSLAWWNLVTLWSLEILRWREVWWEILLEVLLRWSWLVRESHLALWRLVLMRVVIERFLILVEVLVDWSSLGWRRAECLLLLWLWLRKSLWWLVELLVTKNVLLLIELRLLMVNRDWSGLLLLDWLWWGLLMVMVRMERFRSFLAWQRQLMTQI
jgi:hypothetical protein